MTRSMRQTRHENVIRFASFDELDVELDMVVIFVMERRSHRQAYGDAAAVCKAISSARELLEVSAYRCSKVGYF